MTRQWPAPQRQPRRHRDRTIPNASWRSFGKRLSAIVGRATRACPAPLAAIAEAETDRIPTSEDAIVWIERSATEPGSEMSPPPNLAACPVASTLHDRPKLDPTGVDEASEAQR